MQPRPLFSPKNTPAASARSQHLFLRSTLLWIAFLATTAAFAQQPFITTWKTDIFGTSNSHSIIIRTTGGGYNYEVDWNNDGTYDESGITGDVTHDFGVAGTYTIRIRGDFPRIYFAGGDSHKLLNVGQWGDVAWTSMASAFYTCSNLQISATDLPNLSGVTDLTSMFRGCYILNGPANIGSWNTANVTDMSYMFYDAHAFNQPVGNWNTAAVINMNAMFQDAPAFNQPVGNWNTANVTNMSSMFYQATAFNQPIGNWNTANVTNMSSMFYYATAFNQPIGNWNTAAVTNMSNIFVGASAFDQPIGNWNTAAVTNMKSMFGGATTFNQPIGNWNTAAVTNMNAMFQGAPAFNQPIGNWNTAAVTNMSRMFEGASAFNQPIMNWHTANVTDMSSMFSGAHAFSQPIGNWNTANVTDMDYMFFDADAFNQPIGTWNTANVTNMSTMFDLADAFNQPLSNWNTANVTNMSKMFRAARAFNQPIGNWNTTNVTDISLMFADATAFNQSLGNWNTANVTKMNGMFSGAHAFNQPIGNWNTANVTDMRGMFSDATAFNQSLGNWTLHSSVNLISMLENNGMDCDHYSATLIAWSANPATPNGLTLGARGRRYGTNAVAARTNLDITKGWSIGGDYASGVDCSGALPVGWLAFSGKQQGNSVLLEWQTATEQNNQGFHIERSMDGLRWTDIGFVAGKGTTSEAQDYSFLDEKPLPGLNYYRLRQTDFDGKETLSKVVSVNLQNVGMVRVFPNPVAKGELTLLLPENTDAAFIVQLFSPLGQLWQSMTMNGGPNVLDVRSLPAGTYTLRIVCGTESFFEKLVVQH